MALLPIGRHSHMNAVSVQVMASRRNVEAQQSALLHSFDVQSQMFDWTSLEARRLAARSFPRVESISVLAWQEKLPAKEPASSDAVRRFLAWASVNPN